MAEAARIEPDDLVLEIGTGSAMRRRCMPTLPPKSSLSNGCGNLPRRRGSGCRRDAQTSSSAQATPRKAGEKAPFDVIVVAAGGPAIPVSLQEQLEVGGRLVMPVGAERGEQRLRRIKRVAANKYEEEDLGGVLFVPLIGGEGWPERHFG